MHAPIIPGTPLNPKISALRLLSCLHSINGITPGRQCCLVRRGRYHQIMHREAAEAAAIPGFCLCTEMLAPIACCRLVITISHDCLSARKDSKKEN